MRFPDCPQCKRGDRVDLDTIDGPIEWWTCWRCQLDYSVLSTQQCISEIKERDVPLGRHGSADSEWELHPPSATRDT